MLTLTMFNQDISGFVNSVDQVDLNQISSEKPAGRVQIQEFYSLASDNFSNLLKVLIDLLIY